MSASLEARYVPTEASELRRIRRDERRAAAALLAGAVAAAALWVGLALAPATPATLPPCATEDSVSCHWDGSTQGNGHGDTFDVKADGTLYNVVPGQ